MDTPILSGPNVYPYPADQPDQHGFVILGKRNIFLAHFMMFPMADHQYQVIMEANIGRDQKSLYLQDYKEYPSRTHTLANNPDVNKMILPSLVHGFVTKFDYQMYRGVPVIPSEHAVLLAEAELKIERMIVFRHFDLDYNAQYPPMQSYYIYGKGDEAFISHYVSKGPNFQHEGVLKEVPDFLSPKELEEGVVVSIPSLPAFNGSLPETAPLTPGQWDVVMAGKKGIHTIEFEKTIWFDTNLINSMNH